LRKFHTLFNCPDFWAHYTQIGLTGSRRLVVVIPMVLAFIVLIAIVIDLDHPQKGMIKVNQQAMINLQNSMNRGKK